MSKRSTNTNDQDLLKEFSKLLDNKLNAISKTLKDLKVDKIDKIEESICFLSNQYHELYTKTVELETTKKDLVKENKYLAASLHGTVNDLQQVKQELNDLHQYSRRDCLELRGVPCLPNENTNEIVQKVGDLIGVRITDDDDKS